MPATILLRSLLIGLLAIPLPALALDRHALLDEANLLVLPRERSLPDIELLDHEGRAFNTATLRDRWHVLFFGFTACPDVCPTTLSDMRRALNQLTSEERQQLQVVLVTADPARDTPEQLKRYLGYYRAGFIGLTGEIQSLQTLSKALGLPFVPASETTGNYNVAHSANLALVAPDGTLRAHIRSPLKLEALPDALRQIMVNP